jgi:hypothetical protein
MTQQKEEIEYSIRLYKNNNKISSTLTKKDAMNFIITAQHLIHYLTKTIEEKE